MAPFLETVKSFADVPITNDGIDTLAFLEASEGVVRLFKLLQNAAFAPVVSDLEGNITKLRTRYLAHPTHATTLERLVRHEQSEKARPATEGLLWLLRGLSFTYESLHTAQRDPNTELATAFSKGYEVSLKAHHNFLVRGVFSMAMRACPYRKDFYAKLAADPELGGGASVAGQNVDKALDRWLEGLNKRVGKMQTVYEENGYGKP